MLTTVSRAAMISDPAQYGCVKINSIRLPGPGFIHKKFF